MKNDLSSMAHGYIDIGYAEASKEHLEAFLSCFAIKRRQYMVLMLLSFF